MNVASRFFSSCLNEWRRAVILVGPPAMTKIMGTVITRKLESILTTWRMDVDDDQKDSDKNDNDGGHSDVDDDDDDDDSG